LKKNNEAQFLNNLILKDEIEKKNFKEKIKLLEGEIKNI
jgi:hypothetical protein